MKRDLDREVNWIGGQAAYADGILQVINPATGERAGSVPDCGEEEVRRAVEAAAAALPLWSGQTAGERAGVLNHWANLLMEHREELALLMTREQGKPLTESIGEIGGAADIIRWYAEEGKRAYGEIIPSSNPGQELLVYREPIGVVALITPMNFPAATVARKVAPALAAGCTLVLKPAETTPMTAIAMFGLLMETNLPAGAANLVTGQPAIVGEALLSHPSVRKISFTGSTQVGKRLMSQASQTVKKVSLELGGNCPVIVFPDTDLDRAVNEIAGNKFENCGQVCNGINRIYVHREVREAFTEKLLERVSNLRVGNGESTGRDIGPLISDKALAKVERLVGDAVNRGARVLAGGERLFGGEYENGYFYAPTVLDGVTSEMDIVREEIFGPVATLLFFDTEEEALELANDTPYGLAAYLYTKDYARIRRLVSGLQTGNVAVNGTSLAYTQAPFGGIKESGIGREGGRHGLDEFLALKYVALTAE